MKRKLKQLVVVNNFTNINKTNNYLSPQITEHKKTVTYGIGNPGPGLRQAQKCCMFQPFILNLEVKLKTQFSDYRILGASGLSFPAFLSFFP